MVHRLTSEIHDMTACEQDFIFEVLGGEDVTAQALGQLRDLCERFEV